MIWIWLKTFFGTSSNAMSHNVRTGLKTYFLTFPNDGRIEIMSRSEVVSQEKGKFQVGYIHLAIGVGSKEKVDEVTAYLSSAGYSVLDGPRTTGDGYYESSVMGIEKIFWR
ncbi:MAG: glyoxalase [Flavobacteriales bacterium]|nr:glyoxalase [Flavobacteriales bacterium]